MTQSYTTVFTIVLVVLGVLMLACLLRAILGPRTADRIISINMTGTIAIMIIAVLSVMLRESYLLDIAVIYTLLSFLAVVVLVKIFIGVYRSGKEKEKKEAEE